jgi:hypothetical protein
VLRTVARRRSALVFALVFGVLFVHSLPEGLAIGSAYAFDAERPDRVRHRRHRAAAWTPGSRRSVSIGCVLGAVSMACVAAVLRV